MSESSPFEFFRGEISSQDVEVRADAMGKSHLIASLMRPQSVRSDLFPLLNERIETEMDQVLLQMTESLTKMFDQMGGSAGLNSIAPIYSKLFVVEETVVRNAAAASAVAHFERMKNSGEKMDADTAKTWLNLASNIISPPNDEEKDVFYPRCAIPSVISSLYAVLSDETDKETLRASYSALVRDDFSIVRRAVCSSLVDFAAKVAADKPAMIDQELTPLFEKLAKDDNEVVLVMVAECYAPYANLLRQAGGSLDRMVTLVRDALVHRSWRVRLAVAENMARLPSIFSPDQIKTELMNGVFGVLRDIEADVRQLVVPGITSFIDVVGAQTFATEAMPTFHLLTEDACVQVRKELAKLVVTCLIKIGPKGNRELQDVVSKLMADEESVVKMAVLENLPTIVESLPQLLQDLTPALKEQFAGQNWRIRHQIVTNIHLFVKCQGAAYFSDHFLATYLACFRDSVYEVRLGTASSLAALADAAGSDWVQDRIMPTVNTMISDEYTFRIGLLSGVSALFESDIPDNLQVSLLDVLATAAADVVPNVRLKTAQVYARIGGRIQDSSRRASIKQTLKEMMNDKDKDVIYFSSQAMKVFG